MDSHCLTLNGIPKAFNIIIRTMVYPNIMARRWHGFGWKE
jgi:hypothetical protein